MNIEVLAVPYDSGHENRRLGRGPGWLLEGGLIELLQRHGHEVAVRRVRTPGEFHTEIRTAFDLCRRVAEGVREARRRGWFPLVLSGNCMVALGTIAGLGPADLGIVWLDSHGEYNIPETTLTGYLDGMGLAIASGDCWRVLAGGIPGFVPVPAERIVLVGGHDFDPLEMSRLASSEIALVNAAEISAKGLVHALGPPLNRLKARCARVYLHIDLDVLDPAEARANELATSGGTPARIVEEAVSLVKSRFEIAGGGLAGYDPASDPDDRARRAAYGLLIKLFEPAPAADGPKT